MKPKLLIAVDAAEEQDFITDALSTSFDVLRVSSVADAKSEFVRHKPVISVIPMMARPAQIRMAHSCCTRKGLKPTVQARATRCPVSSSTIRTRLSGVTGSRARPAVRILNAASRATRPLASPVVRKGRGSSASRTRTGRPRAPTKRR